MEPILNSARGGIDEKRDFRDCKFWKLGNEQRSRVLMIGRVAPDQDLAEMEVLDDILGVSDVLGGCAGLF